MRGHKEAVTSMNYDDVCGLISCSMTGYDVKIWDPKTLNLLLVLNQLTDTIDAGACHPNPI